MSPGAPPNRPDHPDYWRISEIVLALDALVEAGTTVDAAAAVLQAGYQNAADLGSVTYTAIQRARHLGGGRGPVLLQALAAMWLEGFTVGMAFEQKGGHQE
jgi:hypothetical protein